MATLLLLISPGSFSARAPPSSTRSPAASAGRLECGLLRSRKAWPKSAFGRLGAKADRDVGGRALAHGARLVALVALELQAAAGPRAFQGASPRRGVSRETLRRVLHHLGFRWRRPRPLPPSKDPQQKRKRLKEILKNLLRREWSFFQDETKLELNPRVGFCWMRRGGKQKRLRTPGTNPAKCGDLLRSPAMVHGSLPLGSQSESARTTSCL